MKTHHKILLAFLFINIAPITQAWNYTGHVLIAQVAFDNLTPVARQQANVLAENIYSHLPATEQEKLNNHYPDASTFAKIAILPDVWRKWHLQTISNRLDAPLTTNFKPFALDSIQPWHFINEPYPQTIHCSVDPKQNVVWAIQQTEIGWTETKNSHADALLMVLQEHFVGDVHQPLHIFNQVNSQCQNDRGGNDYCLKYNNQGKCSKSLHALWDSGVGYLKPKTDIQQVANQLQGIYPKSLFSQRLAEKNPSTWIAETYHDMPFIYSTPENSKPNFFYLYHGHRRTIGIGGLSPSQLAESGTNLIQ